MLKEMETYTGLSEPAKQSILALSIVFGRIAELSKADNDDLFDLLGEWRNCGNFEEARGIQRAMEEILAQVPIRSRALPLDRERPMPRGLRSWTKHVGQKIKEFRELAKLNQTELAEKAGLTQSHISRLERAEHSPTNFTLEKIANALSIEVRQLDPASH